MKAVSKFYGLFLLATVSFANVQTAVSAETRAVENGRSKYQQNCQVCHGAAGKGDGIAASELRHKPSNLPNKLNSWFKTDAGLIKKIMRGKGEMPAWQGILSEADVKDIFSYIRSVN